MKLEAVRDQIDELYLRAITIGFSVQQNHCLVETGARLSIGDLRGSEVSLKNVPYEDVYAELDRNNAYHLKLPDGALMIFQYQFGPDQIVKKHRLAYFPCPSLPSPEEAPELYSRDDLYADILMTRIVRFPIRFDFDPSNYKPSFHAASHLTLGQFENCRIPASHPVSPHAFWVFVARNFYFQLFRKHQNAFEKSMRRCIGQECITDFERRMTRLEVGV